MAPATMIHRVAVRLASDGPSGKGDRISGPGVIGTAYRSRRDAKLRRAGFRSANHEDRPLDYPNEEWQHKGATLSDKTARQEFGLTQDEIHDAINAGTLQYRRAAMHGNPWLRLLRREVEALARTRHGDRHVSEQQARAELKHVNREIRRLRAELAELEERRAKLGSDLGT
jgi:hypothetical protein